MINIGLCVQLLLNGYLIYVYGHFNIRVRPTFLFIFFPGRDQYYSRLFFVGLLSREHSKAQPGGWFLLLFLEKPGVEPANPGLQGE